MWKKLDKGFPQIDKNAKNVIPNIKLWSWNKLWLNYQKQTQIFSTTLEERLGYLPFLFTGKDL